MSFVNVSKTQECFVGGFGAVEITPALEQLLDRLGGEWRKDGAALSLGQDYSATDMAPIAAELQRVTILKHKESALPTSTHLRILQEAVGGFSTPADAEAFDSLRDWIADLDGKLATAVQTEALTTSELSPPPTEASALIQKFAVDVSAVGENAPPQQTPAPRPNAQSPDAYIAKCLAGLIDASTGVTGNLPDGLKVFVQSPVSDAQGANDTVVVGLPAYTHVVAVRGFVPAQMGSKVFPVAMQGAASGGVRADIEGQNLTLTGVDADWQSGGYVAFVFVE